MANYFDDAQNKGEYNGQTFYDKNKWLQASGYQKQGGGGDIRPYTGSYSAPGGYEDIVAKQIAMQQKANEPAVQALEASKAPLEQKYKDLIASIKGNQQVAETRQTTVTNNELGKRGLNPNTDTLAAQDMTNALNPVTQQYASMTSDATNNAAKAQSDLALQIANLKSGAASTGINQGLDLYNQDQTRLATQLERDRLAQQQKDSYQLALNKYNQIDLPESKATIQNIMSTINNRNSSSTGGADEAAALASIFGQNTVWNNGAPYSSNKPPISSFNR